MTVVISGIGTSGAIFGRSEKEESDSVNYDRVRGSGPHWVVGEYWDASADEDSPGDAPVEVTAVAGMQLRVKKAPADH